MTSNRAAIAAVVFAFAATFGCALSAATALADASSRADAVIVVPIGWSWGAIALAAAWWLRDRPCSATVAFGLAVAVRAPLLAVPAHLSDDLYRYLWEGMVLSLGHNPFAHPPASLVGLDDALLARVNHPQVSSIYPPVALVWFRALHALGGTAEVARLFASLADAATAAGIAWVLRGRGRPTWPALLYALHPLAALESGAGAHLEAPAIALTTLGIGLRDRGRAGLALGMLGAAAGTKLLPALLVPPIASRLPIRAAAATLTVVASLLLLLAVPVLDAGADLLRAFHNYRVHWSFNGFAFPVIEPWLGALTRPALLGTGAIVTAWAWTRPDPVDAWRIVGAAFVLLTPTAHPWYVLWAVVPALLAGRWGWAVAGVSCLGSYSVLATFDPSTGTWHEQPWLWWLTWLPAIAALGAETWWRRSGAPTR